jgi:hypothetical protein
MGTLETEREVSLTQFIYFFFPLRQRSHLSVVIIYFAGMRKKKNDEFRVER